MSALFSNITLPEANMWNSCEIVCEKQVYFTQFSYDFDTFSHVSHLFSHACEIILCERHWKDRWKTVWNHVILFTSFSYTFWQTFSRTLMLDLLVEISHTFHTPLTCTVSNILMIMYVHMHVYIYKKNIHS